MLTRLRDMFVDGLLFALPVLLVWVLLQKVIDLVARLLAPAADAFPAASWLGLAGVDLLAVLLLILGLVAIGAFTRSRSGRGYARWMERVVLQKIPGYRVYRSMMTGFSSEGSSAGFTPALVAFDDNTVLGFIVEPATEAHDMVTVFVPASPTPASGSVVVVTRSRVTPLNISVVSAVHIMTRGGRGLQQLTSSGANPGEAADADT